MDEMINFSRNHCQESTPCCKFKQCFEKLLRPLRHTTRQQLIIHLRNTKNSEYSKLDVKGENNQPC